MSTVVLIIVGLGCAAFWLSLLAIPLLATFEDGFVVGLKRIAYFCGGLVGMTIVGVGMGAAYYFLIAPLLFS